MTETVKRHLRQPHEGDVLRTEKYGDVTVDRVGAYGRYVLATDAAGKQRTLYRAADEEWLRVGAAPR